MNHDMTSPLVQIFRACRLLLHIVSGLTQAFIYPHVAQTLQRRMTQNWSAGLLGILNIKLRVHGDLPDVEKGAVMLAANHVSWLDVYSLNAASPAHFVAKAEIARWPVLGWLSRQVGTLFIERAKRSDTARINQDIAAALAKGDRVAVFPEGTTSDGNTLRHFHASLLQPAVLGGAWLYPAAIRYTDARGNFSTATAYVDISMQDSLRQILRQPLLHVDITFAAPIHSPGKNRRELARAAEQAIASALSLPLPHSGLPPK